LSEIDVFGRLVKEPAGFLNKCINSAFTITSIFISWSGITSNCFSIDLYNSRNPPLRLFRRPAAFTVKFVSHAVRPNFDEGKGLPGTFSKRQKEALGAAESAA
jgi:hypothetical protein